MAQFLVKYKADSTIYEETLDLKSTIEKEAEEVLRKRHLQFQDCIILSLSPYNSAEMNDSSESSSPFEDIEDTLSNDFQFWRVAENGDISRSDREYIEITSQHLLEQNWLTIEMEKERHRGTANAEREFYFAYIEALRRAGYKKIIIDVRDIYAPIIEITE